MRSWTDYAIDDAWKLGLTVDWESIEAAERQLLERQLADYRTRYPEVSVAPVVVRDRPPRTLLDHAKNAQLVVVGSRGRGGSAACCSDRPARP